MTFATETGFLSASADGVSGMMVDWITYLQFADSFSQGQHQNSLNNCLLPPLTRLSVSTVTGIGWKRETRVEAAQPRDYQMI